MKSIVDVMTLMERAVGESSRGSIEAVKHEFTLAQTEAGADTALHALATLYVIAEKQRRALREWPADPLLPERTP